VTGSVTPLIHLPRGVNDPLVVRSRELETVQNFLAAHGVTFAMVVRTERPQVLWSDLRYCGPLERRSAPWAPTAPEHSPVSCALWFGGEFDSASGVATASMVYVGHLVQRRLIR
jgi:hypothetical protein